MWMVEELKRLQKSKVNNTTMNLNQVVLIEGRAMQQRRRERRDGIGTMQDGKKLQRLRSNVDVSV